MISADLTYYIIHEGAHFIYALLAETYKKINIKDSILNVESIVKK